MQSESSIQPNASNKLLLGALSLLALLVVGGVIAFFMGSSAPTPPTNATPLALVAERATRPAGSPTEAPTVTGQQTVAAITPVAQPSDTAVSLPPTSTDTPQPLPSDTPVVAPTAPPTFTAAPPTATPKAGASRPKATATKDPNIMPNGVRYGDHTPNLPDRIVRIASPNIKLDAKVYEVYAKNGAWEVADYAAGHNYNSMNPGEGGNIVLAGHNNWHGEVFRYLEFLSPGNEIDVWTLEGKEYKYKVQSVQKLLEAGASMAVRIEHGKVMDPTPSEQLTLITCWPYTTYTHRLVVIAKPVQ
jgi:sortase A